MDGINPAYARFCKTVLWLLLLAGLSLIMLTLAFLFGPLTLDSFLSSAPPI